jgi:hypothetical protein
LAKQLQSSLTVMMKITTHKEQNRVRLVVEGKLSTSSISVLEHCWREAMELAGSPLIHVEFADITFVDEHAKRLLKQMDVAGVELSAKEIHMMAILENIKTNRKEEKEL